MNDDTAKPDRQNIPKAAHISAKVVPSPSTAAGKFPGSVYCDNTAQKEL